jgi:hypothetical protein
MSPSVFSHVVSLIYFLFTTTHSVTATAVYCTAMPAPRVLEISRNIAVQDAEDQQVLD